MKNLTLLLLLISPSLFAMELTTIAEKSDWIKTGNAQETSQLCANFAKRFPQKVSCGTYGVTPEGRKLPYLRVHDGSGKGPVIWVQGGIHAGEIDGKDAVFWLLKDLLEKKINTNPIQGIQLVFIPIVNLDGHERSGKWNRPNQVGPEEMGWRTTAQNLNLNRDFAKAQAPEMKALIKLWNQFDPVLSLDLHVTDGAHFQPEVGLIILPATSFGQTELHQAGTEFEKMLLKKMEERKRLALPFYPSFEDELNPLSGFSRYVSTPRFSQGYWFNRGRLGMLVETHSWKDYKTRVQTHRDTVLSTLEIAKLKAHDWLQASKKFRQSLLAGKSVDLEFKNDGKSRTIDFPAYKFKVEDSKISKGKVLRYDLNEPEIWKVPFYENLIPALTVNAPEKGYYVPAYVASMVSETLKVHEIKFRKLKKDEIVKGQVYRAHKTEFSPSPFEGRQTLKVTGSWNEEEVKIGTGSLFVPIHQQNARMLLQLLEPEAKDSLLFWGQFNAYFERKEYMEAYVAEDVAIEMLKDPKIEKEFADLCKADEAFAKDPDRRHEFFYRKHSSWDHNFNRYPVIKK